MLNHRLLAEDGILVIEPRDAPSFPGWEDFAGFVSHMRFVHDHHQRIRRVAAVSDDTFLSVAPKLATHFVDAEVRHFGASDRDAAMTWLREGERS